MHFNWWRALLPLLFILFFRVKVRCDQWCADWWSIKGKKLKYINIGETKWMPMLLYTECFNGYYSYVIHMQWLLQVLPLNPVEHPWDILGRRVSALHRHHPIIKWGNIFWRMFILSVQRPDKTSKETEHWDCSGGSWWDGVFVLVFPLIGHRFICFYWR